MGSNGYYYLYMAVLTFTLAVWAMIAFSKNGDDDSQS